MHCKKNCQVTALKKVKQKVQRNLVHYAHTKHLLKTGTTIFIPYDVLQNPSLVLSNIRHKLPATAISTTTETLILVCDGDPSAVNLYYLTAHRQVDKYLLR